MKYAGGDIMQRYVLCAVCVALLAAGCSSGPSNTIVQPAEEETTAVQVTTAEESGEGKQDSSELEAAVSSLEARLESMESLSESMEESVQAMEASVQEVMSSMAEEVSLAEGEPQEEELRVSYDDLIRSPEDYTDQELTYTGSILQIASLDSSTEQILIAVDEDEDHGLVCEYGKDILSENPGHGAVVTVTGIFGGVNRYMMGNGTRVELPALTLSEITVDRVEETEPEPAPETVPVEMPETTVRVRIESR